MLRLLSSRQALVPTMTLYAWCELQGVCVSELVHMRESLTECRDDVLAAWGAYYEYGHWSAWCTSIPRIKIAHDFHDNSMYLQCPVVFGITARIRAGFYK